MVCDSLISNLTITPRDITTANYIFGTDTFSLKRNMVQRQPNPVVSEYVGVPSEILKFNKQVSISANMIFVNGLEFLVSVLQSINFTMVQYIGSPTKYISSNF